MGGGDPLIFDFFRKKKETRAQTLTEESFDRALRSGITESEVTEQNIMEIPAVQSAIYFLAGTVSQLPVRLYRRSEDGTEEIKDDYRLGLLNRETGDTLDAQQWKFALVRDYLLHGEGYSVVDFSGNRLTGLYYVKNQDVAPIIGTDPIRKYGKYMVQAEEIPDYRMLRILRNTKNGLDGIGIIESNQEQLSLMLNTVKFERDMVHSGGLKKIFLKVAKGQRVTQDIINQLKRAWDKLCNGTLVGNAIILNDGIDAEEIGQTAVETQLNENKLSNAHQVYKMLGIVPAAVDGGATPDDIKNTVRFAIRPIVKALESAINRFCLLEAEKGIYNFRIDMDELDSTDVLQRYQAYKIGIDGGFLQVDDVRRKEGKNPFNFEFVRLGGLDSVLYNTKTGEIFIPNTKQVGNIEDMKGGDGVNASRNKI